MNISSSKHPLVVTNADLTASRFTDINLSGTKLADVNLANVLCDVLLARWEDDPRKGFLLHSAMRMNFG